MAKILIVEDEGVVAKGIESKLNLMGHEVSGIAKSVDEALVSVKEKMPDLVLMDINLQGDKDGIQLALELNEKYQLPIIYLTAYFDDETLARAKLTKPYGFIIKPFGAADLRANITMALFKHQAEVSNRISDNTIIRSFKCIHEGLIIADQKGNILLMNSMAEKMTGWRQKDAAGKQAREILRMITCDEARAVDDLVLKAINEHKSVVNEEHLFLISKDESKTIIKIETIPVEDDDGSIVGVVCVLRNSSDAVSLEDIDLRKMGIELKESSVFVDDINSMVHDQMEHLSVMSSKMRSPINALMVYTQLLKKAYLDKGKNSTNEILASGNNLLSIMTDVLNILKVETSQLKIEREKFCLDYLINELALSSYPKLKEKNLQLINKVDDKVPENLIGDKRLLKQILINLLDNAIKFTNNGEVGLAINCIKCNEGNDEVTLEFLIHDTGIGIPKDKQGIVFESFVQADFNVAKKYGGVGLGLTLAKAYIEILNGKISIHSAEGEGTEIRIELPFLCENTQVNK